MKTDVLIIGNGEIGKAIALLLRQAGESRVVQWDSDPAKNANLRTLEELAPFADTIFLCIPSRAVRGCMERLKGKTSRSQLFVALSKGIEQDSKKTVEDVLKEFLHVRQIVLLFGPMIAEEILNGNPAAAILACKKRKSATRVGKLFASGLSLGYSSDVRGVALSGVMKNVYSIGLGIIHGINLGTNFRGWYVAKSIEEMAGIIKILGGKSETAYSVAGLGDLVATGFSSDSKNHLFGKDLALSGTSDLASEGGDSFAALTEILGNKIKYFKILSVLRRIILGNESAKDIFPGIINES